MFSDIRARVQKRTRTFDRIILGVITGGKRISRGAAWPDGRPPHLTERRQDSREPGGKCGGGLQLFRCITTGYRFASLPNPILLQALRHSQEHIGQLPQDSIESSPFQVHEVFQLMVEAHWIANPGLGERVFNQ